MAFGMRRSVAITVAVIGLAGCNSSAQSSPAGVFYSIVLDKNVVMHAQMIDIKPDGQFALTIWTSTSLKATGINCANSAEIADVTSVCEVRRQIGRFVPHQGKFRVDIERSIPQTFEGRADNSYFSLNYEFRPNSIVNLTFFDGNLNVMSDNSNVYRKFRSGERQFIEGIFYAKSGLNGSFLDLYCTLSNLQSSGLSARAISEFGNSFWRVNIAIREMFERAPGKPENVTEFGRVMNSELVHEYPAASAYKKFSQMVNVDQNTLFTYFHFIHNEPKQRAEELSSTRPEGSLTRVNRDAFIRCVQQLRGS